MSDKDNSNFTINISANRTMGRDVNVYNINRNLNTTNSRSPEEHITE